MDHIVNNHQTTLESYIVKEVCRPSCVANPRLADTWQIYSRLSAKIGWVLRKVIYYQFRKWRAWDRQTEGFFEGLWGEASRCGVLQRMLHIENKPCYLFSSITTRRNLSTAVPF